MENIEFFQYLQENFKSCEVLENGGYYARDNNGSEYFFSEDCTKGDVSYTSYIPGLSGRLGNGSTKDRLLCDQLLAEGVPSGTVVTVSSASEDKSNVMAQIDMIAKDNNIHITDVQAIGFSAGGGTTYTRLDQYLANNPDIEKCSMVSIDAYWMDDVLNGRRSCENLKNRQVPIYTIRRGEFSNRVNIQNEKLVANGYNCYLITANSDLNLSHSDLRTKVFQDKLYFYMAGSSDEFTNMNDYTICGYRYNEDGELVLEPLALDQARIHKSNIGNLLLKFSNLSTLENVSVANVSVLGTTATSVQSDSDVLASYLNGIIGQVRSSSFLTQSGYDYETTFSSTTNVPSKIPVLVRNYFSSTADLLQKIAGDTYQFANIGRSYDQRDTEMAKEAETLGAKTGLDNLQGATTEKTKPVGNSPLRGHNTPFARPIPINIQDAEDQMGGDNNRAATIPPKPPIPSKPTRNTRPNENRDTTAEFPPFSELSSDENKTVYNYNDGCKIIVYKEGDKVTGIEYYYDFKTNENAIQAIDSLLENFQDNPNFKEIMSNDRYVKVIMDESMYKDLNLSMALDKYKDLS